MVRLDLTIKANSLEEIHGMLIEIIDDIENGVKEDAGEMCSANGPSVIYNYEIKEGE